MKNMRQIVIGLLLAIFGIDAQCAEVPCSARVLTSEPDKLLASLATTKDEWWLSHGQGCYSEAETDSCDWKTTLKQDIPVGADRRLLVYNANHLTGSGAWDAIRLVGCFDGAPHVLLSGQYFYEAKIEVISSQELFITSGDWQSKDPKCCPSKEKREHYVWSESNGKYVLQGTSVGLIERSP